MTTLRKALRQPDQTHLENLLRCGRPLLVAGAVSALVWFGTPLSVDARLALIVFALAVVGWTMTNLDEAFVSLSAALALPLLGVRPGDALFTALGDPLVWLLFAAFILAAAVGKTGLLGRVAGGLAARAHTTAGLFGWAGLGIFLSVFLVPSTSGRAALLLPVFLALAGATDNSRVRRALALLFPVVILLSAFATPLGAGANLVTAELLREFTGTNLGFGRWVALALPFTAVSCAVSVWVILRLFLTGTERRAAVKVPPPAAARFSAAEGFVLAVLGATVLGWATEGMHGVSGVLIATVGALAVTLPRVGVLSFKEALREVKWDLLLFLAATTELGRALVTTGAAAGLLEAVLGLFGPGALGSPTLFIALVALLALLSHLLIVSRTARASVLIPAVLLLSTSLGHNPALAAFVATAAFGFCLTMPVSAKPVALFGRDGGYRPRDLLRLSAVLLPVHLVLLVVFALAVWPLMGLPLEPASALATPSASTVVSAR